MFGGRPDALAWLKGRRVAIGIGGGIACYKVASVVSTLAQAGCETHVAMTPAAVRFVAPLTFEALAGRAVHTSIWDQPDQSDPQHIRLAQAVDACLVAPCTMDLLAKIVHGMCDDPVSLLVASIDRGTKPVILAPSMNDTMWRQPANQRNLAVASEDGYRILSPGCGWQACRTLGTGRLPEPDELVEAVALALGWQPRP
jgi:phosphopantothenoylcysteine synthetase/decarboxylase